MARTSTLDLYDRLLDGELRQLLLTWRAEALSLDEMAYRLRDRQVTASRSTVGRWLKVIDAEVADEAVA